MLALSVACLLPTAAASRSSTFNPFAGAPDTTDMFFVPLDTHAQQLLKQIVPKLQVWLPPNQRLQVTPTRKGWANSSRHGELNATKVATDVLNLFQEAAGARPVTIFAVSSQFVYSPTLPYFSFVFGAWVQPAYLQYSAVFGTGPMRAVQPSREKARLTKFMLRYIGEIVCRPYLTTNSDPKSVLYSPVLSTTDLDRMVPTLPAHCGHRP